MKEWRRRYPKCERQTRGLIRTCRGVSQTDKTVLVPSRSLVAPARKEHAHIAVPPLDPAQAHAREPRNGQVLCLPRLLLVRVFVGGLGFGLGLGGDLISTARDLVIRQARSRAEKGKSEGRAAPAEDGNSEALHSSPCGPLFGGGGVQGAWCREE